MRCYCQTMIMLVITLVLLNPALQAQNIPHGSYIPNIILNAPWDAKNLLDNGEPSKPGTFGISKNEQGIECGPTSFTVAPNGDIYIDDAINHRVQSFSTQGNFIKVIPNAWGSFYAGLYVDQEGNIYSPDPYTSHPAVYKFDQNGNQVKIYPIAKDEEMGTDRPYKWSATGISCDDSGRVFIQYTKHSGTPSIFQIGTTDMEFSPAQQKTTLKEAMFGATANIPNMNKVFREVGLLGVDKDAVYTIQKDEQNPNTSIISKSTYNGRFIATYALDWSQVKCELITSFSMNKNTVFDKGNIYNFCSDKNGIRVIKWSPVEGGK